MPQRDQGRQVSYYLGCAVSFPLNNTTTSRLVRSTPVRLAQALEGMGASAETVVDADDQPHLAAVR